MRPIQPIYIYISTNKYAFYRPAYTYRECLIGAVIRYLIGIEIFVNSHCHSYYIYTSLYIIVFVANASQSKPRRGYSSVSTTTYKASPLSFIASLIALLAALLLAVGVCDILNMVYPEDLAIQRDNVLIQSSRVVNLVIELIKVYPRREGGSSYRSIH